METLFVNNVPIRITEDTKVLEAHAKYDHFSEYSLSHLSSAYTAGYWLVKATPDIFDELLLSVQQKRYGGLQGITVWVEHYKPIEALLERRCKTVKAAGGVVSRDDQVLMIRRRGRWEFPKGKREKGEKNPATALREVEEECSVKVKLLTKLCTTKHTYLNKGLWMLKETAWYAMACLEDQHMQPQTQEGIEQVAWIDERQLQEIIQHSYQSVRCVTQAYQQYRRRTTDRDAY